MEIYLSKLNYKAYIEHTYMQETYPTKKGDNLGKLSKTK